MVVAGKKNNDWRALLKEEDAPLFESLRAWRTQRAGADAVPPQVILTNMQIARIASGRPRGLTALKEIPGLSQSRLDRFGEEILGILSNGVVSNDDSGSVATSHPTEAAGA